jgi:polysaccharide biosynthesis protein PslG
MTRSTSRRLRRGPLVTAVVLGLVALLGAATGAGASVRGGATAAAPATAEQAAAQWAGRPPIGVSFHGLWSDYTDAKRIQILDQLRGAGVRSVRIDLSWAMLQPNGRTYDPWGVAQVDKVIRMANQRGITPLMMFWLTPGWANGNRGLRTLPSRPADYAAVIGWAAQRWRGKVVGWEIWNEPNSGRFMTGADPGAYTRLLRAAYPAVKKADPKAAVIFGGVQYNDVVWLRRAYDAGAQGYFDAMATHPYQGIADLPPTAIDGTKWTLLHVTAVRALMVARGDGNKEIWFTEFGWSTHPDSYRANWLRGVTQAEQARFLTQTASLVAASLPYVRHLYWYSDVDVANADPQYANYGVLQRDLKPKPLLTALRVVNGG